MIDKDKNEPYDDMHGKCGNMVFLPKQFAACKSL